LLEILLLEQADSKHITYIADLFGQICELETDGLKEK
jgi:hypothetical protein